MKTQICPECTGQYIKTVNTTTGECISCYPCPIPTCVDGYTSSVPCGTTVPVGTEIKCVLLQSDPVVLYVASTQTRRLNSLPLSISSKFIVAPATSIFHPTASSSSSTRSSMKQRDRSDTTKKQRNERELALEEWKKDSSIYMFCGVFLAVAFVAVVFRISRRKGRKQLQLQPVDRGRPDPTLPVETSSDVLSQDNETCSINWATKSVAFTRRNDCTSKTGDGNPRSQCGAEGSAEGKSKSSYLIAAPGN